MSTSKSRRQSRILAELGTAPSLRVAELARILDVSTETIRRDLDELTAQGLLNRTYGGAIRPLSTEPSVTERHLLFQEERQQIARAAVPLLDGARTLMIGSGSTTVHVARRIATQMRDVTVLTHSFGVATVLAINPTIRVVMMPGDYHAVEGATVGAHAIAFLAGFHADVAILGASGLAEDGPSDALLDCGSVYGAMAMRSARTMIAADASKFGRLFPSRYAPWSQIHDLVSNARPDPSLLDALRAHSVRLTLA
ncbi:MULTISPECIES: DeoR/GlpR family DNA-binding transcription regulator [unclassified Aureimonas]|uniref:DeoR/GlpR family DNA-binding transcription regulator n=1 Tax=unclassified Aureimonas TaxID=2615206 RepID=UPI0006FB5726|nr:MULTISPECIES: DeoR/GlpR family DNA-binding transcription regulator [unclassified Aureimonas]KQT69820.1 DeoR family transcriptional regulator [Aureimonas sp. Leaf427]KQT76028.1 DeoR family transcriptional regulator [Aureimonas sp. Leaf460]